METVNVLMLGMEGAGKSLLLRRLSRDSKVEKDKTSQRISADVIKTAGVEMMEVPLGKRAAVLFKEIGGCMVPVWPNYYAENKLLVYVVDVGDHSTLAASAYQLHQMLQDPGWKEKAIALVLNKSDLPATMQRKQVEQILMLPVLERSVQSLDVMEMSAWTGEGTSELLRWIVSHSGIRGL